MRDFGATIINKVNVVDPTTGETYSFFYRRPTNEERIQYKAASLKRQGNKLVRKEFTTDLKFGAAITTGFEKGPFAIDGKVFSSDPLDPDYRTDWKDIIVKGGPELIVTVGRTVFSDGISQSQLQQQALQVVFEGSEDEDAGGDRPNVPSIQDIEIEEEIQLDAPLGS